MTALVVLVCTLALAGCGASTPSKSEYMAKANAVCASANKQVPVLIRQITSDAVALAGGNLKAVARLAGAVQDLHAMAAADLEQLQKIEQPSGESAAIDRFLTPFAGVVSAIGEAATTLTQDPQRSVALLEQVRPTAEHAIAGARSYGLSKCETVFSALA